MSEQPLPPPAAPVLLSRVGETARLVLNRPERHNALVPGLVDALNAALQDVVQDPPAVLVLAGAGRSFSTGGDVRGFLDSPAAARRDYADHLVGGLHSAILALLALPCPVVAAVQGPVTGGSAGFVFAADFVVMAERAFIAPYYVDVGFSPDGGWTALLPLMIGFRRAGAIQLENARIGQAEALALGIATHGAAEGQFEPAVERLIATLLRKSRDSVAATKALLWPPERRARVAAGLAAEKGVFLSRIDLPETEAGMRRFLEKGS